METVGGIFATPPKDRIFPHIWPKKGIKMEKGVKIF